MIFILIRCLVPDPDSRERIAKMSLWRLQLGWNECVGPCHLMINYKLDRGSVAYPIPVEPKPLPL